MYFIISSSEDGVLIYPMNKEKLLEGIEDGDWGDAKILTEMPKNLDPKCWGNSLVIIKGEIVTPKPVETVTKYEI